MLAAMASERHPFLLESALVEPRLGRYSILGCDPFLVMRSTGRTIDVRLAGRRRLVCGDPFDVLQGLLRRYSLPSGASLPFAGGAVGYLGYDLGRQVERLPHAPPDDLGLPEAFVCFYDAAIVVDHTEQATYVVSTGLPAEPGPGRAERARRRLAALEDLVDGAGSAPVSEAGLETGGMTGNFTKPAYLDAVRRVRDYIVAGDVYQVNLSQRFRAPWSGGSLELYRRLRELNPAPFAAFLEGGDFAVVSSSPERMLRLRDGVVETRPIKGTRPRGVTPVEDEALGRELRRSAKDRAEHIMIVDLERSDLGRVCEIGSVHVSEMMALESYATVHHLTSTVRGALGPGRGVADLLRATFPGGSITGAPKIRAMEIIDELEPTRRGVYTGAIGYFSADGGVDLNIAIRTAIVRGGEAFVQLGGGIVYDSDPEGGVPGDLGQGAGAAQGPAKPVFLGGDTAGPWYNAMLNSLGRCRWF